MRAILATVFFCALGALQFGCSVSLEQAVIGRYHGEADITEINPELKPYAQQGMTLIQASLLEIKPKGVARLSGLGNFKGTWKIEDNRLILSRDNGRQAMEFEIEENGKRLVPLLEEEQTKFLGGAKVWFKKE